MCRYHFIVHLSDKHQSRSDAVSMSELLLPIPFQPLLLREYADILQQQYHKRFSLTPCDPPPADTEPRLYTAGDLEYQQFIYLLQTVVYCVKCLIDW